jgi:hypothetical protein
MPASQILIRADDFSHQIVCLPDNPQIPSVGTHGQLTGRDKTFIDYIVTYLNLNPAVDRSFLAL